MLLPSLGHRLISQELHHQPHQPPCQQPRYSLFVLLVIHGSIDKKCYPPFSNCGCKPKTDKNLFGCYRFGVRRGQGSSARLAGVPSEGRNLKISSLVDATGRRRNTRCLESRARRHQLIQQDGTGPSPLKRSCALARQTKPKIKTLTPYEVSF